ncbi:serine hydrolase domain-containing protein [Aliikangiella sp. IMCC44359]|uniref:serine hydrolase domain-containing protein n=1 Tax=Aliikangiella sp. IMCC44359 TaxID=3459125 RepID=UPI00403AC303
MMKINLNDDLKRSLKSLIAIALFSSFSSFAISADKTTNAPEVSAEDRKVSFWDMPYLKNAFIDTTPDRRKDGISVGQLGTNGGNKDKIIKLAQAITEKKYGLVDSLLIAQKGKLLFESYYLRGRANLPHMQASATKSYVSLAVGRAIQLGYLTMADLDRPLVSFFKDLDATKFVKGTEAITLHMALTMQSGVRISGDQMKAFDKNPEQLKGTGQVQTFLENTLPITAESQHFKYQSIDPTLMMQVLNAVVPGPGTAKDFIKKELLDKMGIIEYQWEDDVSGLPMAPYSSSMTSRNMLKWGTLVMNKGKWKGEQLIPSAFITKATNKIVHLRNDDIFFTGDNVSNPGYGYYFWQADMKVGQKNYFTRSIQGGGGQYIILIDELDLIIVTTAHERDSKIMQMTAEKILSAFIK